MMKRFICLALVCAAVLALAPLAMAQQKPEPVIRLGDWVEIGNETFMNIIATADMRYNTAHNMDFEERIRDRANSRDPFNTSNHDQESDLFYVEARWGADFRYQKNLRFQIMFEWQGTLDGNLIDDRHNGNATAGNNPGGTDPFGRPSGNEDDSTNLERVWAEYTFEGTPLRILIGADLWYSDQAGIIGDDDPRGAIYFDLPGGLEIGAWAVLQTSSHRLGLQNDHDFMYYVFHLQHKGMKPMVLGLDAVYFRDRSLVTPAATNRGQKTDTVLIMPSFSGTFGPITALLQPMVILGSVDGGFVAGVQPEYDVFAWGGAAYLEANLGVIRPFVGLYIGSADDDATDNDLQGFAPLPQQEITLTTGTSFFGHLDPSTAIGGRDIVTPARAAGPFGGQEFGHTVGNPFNDRLANALHPGVITTYGNPGTLVIPAGVMVNPVKGHQLTLAYIYRAMLDSAIIEAAVGRSIKETLYHEVMVVWEWTLNSHFDIRLSGSVLIPGEGAKDIAELSTTENCAVGGCQGEDIGFHGQARFRARF